MRWSVKGYVQKLLGPKLLGPDRLLSLWDDGNARVRDLKTGRRVGGFARVSGMTAAAIHAPTGRVAASGAKVPRVYSIDLGKEEGPVPNADPYTAHSRALVCAGAGGSACSGHPGLLVSGCLLCHMGASTVGSSRQADVGSGRETEATCAGSSTDSVASEGAGGAPGSGGNCRGAVPPRGRRRRLWRLLFGLVAGLVLLGLAEGVLRLTLPKLGRGTGVRVSRASRLQKPLASRAVRQWGPKARVSADRFGFRTVPRRPAPVPGKGVILAYGDSNTFGWGLNDDKTWPARLDRLLAPAGYRVVNGGLPGATIVTMLRTHLEAGHKYRPSVVLVAVGEHETFPVGVPDMDVYFPSGLLAARAWATENLWLGRALQQAYRRLPRRIGGSLIPGRGLGAGTSRVPPRHFKAALNAFTVLRIRERFQLGLLRFVGIFEGTEYLAQLQAMRRHGLPLCTVRDRVKGYMQRNDPGHLSPNGTAFVACRAARWLHMKGLIPKPSPAAMAHQLKLCAGWRRAWRWRLNPFVLESPFVGLGERGAGVGGDRRGKVGAGVKGAGRHRVGARGRGRTGAGSGIGVSRHKTRFPSAIAVAPDGKLLAVAFSNKGWVVSAGLGRGRKSRGKLSHRACQAFFSADGRQLVLNTCEGKQVLLIRPAGGETKAVLRHPAGVGPAALLGPHRLFSLCDDGVARVWDLRTSKTLRKFAVTVGMTAAAISVGGGGVAVSGRKLVRVYSIAKGVVVGTVPAPGRGGIREMAYSGDGRLLALGTADGGIAVLDGGTLKRVAKARRHRGPIRGLRFLAGGAQLVSVSKDGTARLWTAPTWRDGRVLFRSTHELISLAVGSRPAGIYLGQETGPVVWVPVGETGRHR